MLVLAIDSAMNGCQACVCDVEINTTEEQQRSVHLLAQKKQEIVRGQAEHLMPMIECVVKESNLSYNELDLIAVTKGPGSFTGMRVAISTAKAIALAAGKPIMGVSTIDAVFDSYKNAVTSTDRTYPFYSVILETKRKDYYFQIFESEYSETAISMGNINHITEAGIAMASKIFSIISAKDILLIGDALDRFKCECSQTWPTYAITIPDGKSIAKLAVQNYICNTKYSGCKPMYLRGAEIGKSRTKPRVIKR